MNQSGQALSAQAWKIVGARVALATLGLCLLRINAEAQNFSLSVQPSATQIALGRQVTYSIALTNPTGFALQNLIVTNGFPSAVQFVSATGASTPSQVFIVTNANNVSFYIQIFYPGASANLQVTLLPTAAGIFTNSTIAVTTSPTNLLSTNVVTQVTAPLADLGISLVGPAPGVLTNDWVTYQLAVTNSGPSAAPGVTVANSLPTGMELISVSPSSQSFTVTNNAVLLSLGTLTNGATRKFSLLVQPTLPGLQTFTAAITSAGVEDTNLANNFASSRISVGTFLPASLLATNASGMAYDAQTALMKQTVRLVNLGTSAVPSARVIVAGLTNWLSNAVGTNNGNPFVVYGASLAPGQSVDLVLEYFVPTRLPISVPNSAYQAVGVPTNTVQLPQGTPIAVTRVVALASGNILVEFPSTVGRSYTILYSDNLFFTNALAAQPAIIAPADRVQWIDDGPPKTVSAPHNTTVRFYEVLLNP